MRGEWCVILTFFKGLLTAQNKTNFRSFLKIHREAISNEEVDLAQRRLAVRDEQHQLLEEAWRSMRWLPEVINQVQIQ